MNAMKKFRRCWVMRKPSLTRNVFAHYLVNMRS